MSTGLSAVSSFKSNLPPAKIDRAEILAGARVDLNVARLS